MGGKLYYNNTSGMVKCLYTVPELARLDSTVEIRVSNKTTRTIIIACMFYLTTSSVLK